MLDEDGYPDKESLINIARWDIREQGIQGLLDLIEDNTKWSDRQIKKTGKRVIYYEYHTGGWGGNEEVIGVLRNTVFWFFFWEKSLRGGHYYFKVRNFEKK